MKLTFKNGQSILHKQQQKILDAALVSLAGFKLHIHTSALLVQLAQQFPNYAEALINPVLNDADEFKRVITDGSGLAAMAKQFPHHAVKLINSVLNDADEFKRVIKNALDLIAIAKQFPNHAEELISPILKDADEFKRIIKSALDLIAMAEQFPNHAEELISSILKDSGKFKKVIQRSKHLIAVATQFPNHAEALIQKVLRNPQYFDTLIFNNGDLHAIKPFCPRIKAIQDATSFQEARSAIKHQMLLKNRKSEAAKLTAFFRGQPQMQGMEEMHRDLAEYQSGLLLKDKITVTDDNETNSSVSGNAPMDSSDFMDTYDSNERDDESSSYLS